MQGERKEARSATRTERVPWLEVDVVAVRGPALLLRYLYWVPRGKVHSLLMAPTTDSSPPKIRDRWLKGGGNDDGAGRCTFFLEAPVP